jgi:Lar family restriction alleviation protein
MKSERCPFCGGISKILTHGTPGMLDPEDFLYNIICTKCGAVTGYYKSEKAAIAAWQRRDMENAKLSRCPLCGGTGMVEVTGHFGKHNTQRFSVKCNVCGLKTRSELYRKNAIANWEQRFEEKEK